MSVPGFELRLKGSRVVVEVFVLAVIVGSGNAVRSERVRIVVKCDGEKKLRSMAGMGTYTMRRSLGVSHVEVDGGLAIRFDIGSTILESREASYRSTVRLSGQPLRRWYVLACSMS